MNGSDRSLFRTLSVGVEGRRAVALTPISGYFGVVKGGTHHPIFLRPNLGRPPSSVLESFAVQTFLNPDNKMLTDDAASLISFVLRL
jgi:hypothetical protein